jgi:ribosome modulation factor
MSIEFMKGQQAAKDGKSAADCPYPTGTKRSQWFAGFFEEKNFPTSQKHRRGQKEDVPSEGN